MTISWPRYILFHQWANMRKSWVKPGFSRVILTCMFLSVDFSHHLWGFTFLWDCYHCVKFDWAWTRRFRSFQGWKRDTIKWLLSFSVLWPFFRIKDQRHSELGESKIFLKWCSEQDDIYEPVLLRYSNVIRLVENRLLRDVEHLL